MGFLGCLAYAVRSASLISILGIGVFCLVIASLGLLAELQKKEAYKALVDSAARLNALEKTKAESDRTYDDQVNGLRSKLKKEVAAHATTREARPYESQLTMLLGISLTSTWLHTCPKARFSPNGLQGKLDQSLADVFAETAESCWLLELKRDYGLIDKEREKTARQNQFSRLISDAEIHRIADRCHWIAWGVEEQAGVPNLSFARHWNAFEYPNSVRVEMTLEECSKHAFLSRARGSIVGLPFMKVRD